MELLERLHLTLRLKLALASTDLRRVSLVFQCLELKDLKQQQLALP
jgi:hypothetical protein